MGHADAFAALIILRARSRDLPRFGPRELRVEIAKALFDGRVSPLHSTRRSGLTPSVTTKSTSRPSMSRKYRSSVSRPFVSCSKCTHLSRCAATMFSNRAASFGTIDQSKW